MMTLKSSSLQLFFMPAAIKWYCLALIRERIISTSLGAAFLLLLFAIAYSSMKEHSFGEYSGNFLAAFIGLAYLFVGNLYRVAARLKRETAVFIETLPVSPLSWRFIDIVFVGSIAYFWSSLLLLFVLASDLMTLGSFVWLLIMSLILVVALYSTQLVNQYNRLPLAIGLLIVWLLAVILIRPIT